MVSKKNSQPPTRKSESHAHENSAYNQSTRLKDWNPELYEREEKYSIFDKLIKPGTQSGTKILICRARLAQPELTFVHIYYNAALLLELPRVYKVVSI